MIFLPLTTDKIELVTSAASTVDVNVNFVDAAAATLVPSAAGKQNTAIVTAATTDILASPGASTTRTLKQMTARNKDASLSNDLTVRYNANGTTYELHKVTLLAGQTLEYIEGVGFFTLKPAAGLDVLKIMPNDTTHATAATFADITGLTQPLLSGLKYSVLTCLFHTNNASTTGSQFSYNIGAAPTAALFGNYSAVTNSVTAGVMSTGTATARDTAITAQTTGQTATGITIIGGFIQPSADGTFAMRATSEVTVASGLVVKAGSWMRLIQEH